MATPQSSSALVEKKSLWARKKEAVECNTHACARILIGTKLLAIVGSIVVAAIAYDGAWITDETCRSRPVPLKKWFMGSVFLDVMSAVLHIFIIAALFFVLKSEVSGARARARAARRGGSAQAQTGEEVSDDAEVPCLSAAMWLMLLSMSVSAFTVFWSFLGFLSAIHASHEDLDDQCESGRLRFWIIVIFSYVNIFGVRAWALADAVAEESSSCSSARTVAMPAV